MLPPPLRPNFLGEYGRGFSGYVPHLVRETPDLFGLTDSAYRPPITGVPQESLRDSIAARLRLEMSERQTVTTAEERYSRSPNGPSLAGEPQEEPAERFTKKIMSFL